MKLEKQILGTLERAYCVAPLDYRGATHFLVASEKNFACLLFDQWGKQVDTVWEHPGGVMSMVQFPGAGGAFLSTHRFYSPNDSKEAGIVLAVPPQHAGDAWTVHPLAALPHVHRFDILERDGRRWLLACTICSGRDYKDDWSYPGKVYAAPLPDSVEVLKAEGLRLTVLREGLLKNHGYCRHVKDGVATALVSSQEGVFRFTPPAAGSDSWRVDTLVEQPVSDIAMADLDRDGVEELVLISPFHGDNVEIHKETRGGWQCVYRHPEPLPFAHAIWAGEWMGVPTAVIGHRQGRRELLALQWDGKGSYQSRLLDSGVGPANVIRCTRADGGEFLLAANREIGEIALYQWDQERS